MQSGWLTQTKFIPPRLGEDFVPRRRLLEALYEAIKTRPLVLLSAPAGYGKTTFLASLPVFFSDLPFAWISLDEDDNDPAHFLSALVFAIQKLNPDFGRNTQTLLETLPDPASESRHVMSTLINEMLQGLPQTWMVLDDLHLITEPVIHASLDYLLERIPPQLRLFIATRHDPPMLLARLRARGHLVEMRAPDLRFTTEEANLFLNEKQRLNLSSDDLKKLQLLAEGWAAGLRLLAGSLDHLPSASDRAAFIRNLASTDRYVFDFLAEEVLSLQEPETRAFLLETSILPELIPALCNALTGRKDAQSMLERLYRRNLFLTKAGETGNVFRYHSLFAEFLREQLLVEYPERFDELHRRAAEAQRTLAPERAIAHFLAAKLWEESRQTIEQVSEEFIHKGWFRALYGWIEALPAAIRDTRPRLLYLEGLCALHGGKLDEAMTLLEKARMGYESARDQEGQGETLLLMAETANRRHDFTQQALLSKQALAFPLPIHGQVQLLMTQVWQSLFQADASTADSALDQALDLTLASNNLHAFNVIAPILNMQLAYLPGGTGRLERYCRQVLSRFGDRIGLIQLCAHSLLGYVLFLNGSLEEAIHEMEQARSAFQRIGGLAYTEAQTLYLQGIFAALQGNPGETEKIWEQFLPQIEGTPMLRPYAVSVLYFIGRMQWIQKKFDHARQTEARITAIVDPEEYPETAMARKLMRALIEISERKFAEGEVTLLQALAIEEHWRHAAIFGSARVLLSYLYLQCKREQETWSLFAPFLGECERRNTPGLILQETAIAVPLLRLAAQRKSHVEFAKRLLNILEVLDAPKPITIDETGQTLTRREVEVLRLIAEGASNQVIARQLVISEHTVKAHITNLYAKLQVTSRVKAITRARELGLI